MMKTIKNFRFLFLIFCIIFFRNTKDSELFAQDLLNQSVVGQGLFTTYTTDNGLPLDAVTASCLDHFGNIWFGTYGEGVSRYDGKSFTNYTTAQGLANNAVFSICEDKMGNLWFGTYGGGVSRYDGKSFTNYTTAQGLANDAVFSILEDKVGNLWFGTYGGGISCYDGKSFKNYTTAQGLANNVVRSILEDKTGNLWFGTNGGGVSCYDGKKFVNYTTAEGLASNKVRSILEDKMGNLWFGTNGGGISCYDGKSFKNYTTAQGLANDVVFSTLEDKTGNLWFGTESGGVSRYDGKSFVNYNTAQGLTSNAVWSILEDKTGNIWFSTYGGGVSRYEGKSFTYYTTAQGLGNNTVWSILEDKTGNLWFGTNGGGVSRYDGKKFVNYTTAEGLANNTVCSILEDKAGNFWFGTNGGGVSRYNGKKFVNYTTAEGLANNIVSCILEDKTGNLWFGTNGGGVSRYDGKSFVNYTVAHGLANNMVRSILEDKTGNLWFGTDGGGISRYDGNFFVNYTTAERLANNTVWNIFEDKTGNLWFGTQKGLSYLSADKNVPSDTNWQKKNKDVKNNQHEQKKNSNTFLFKTITTKNGLPNDYVAQIMKLPNGKIALGTNLGVVFFNLPNFQGEKLTGLELFNSSTGYPIKDVNVGQNTMYLDSKGVIWIATGSYKMGLVCFDYREVNRNSNSPIVIIQNIKINEENICWENIRKENSIKEYKKGNQSSSERNSLYELHDSLTLLMSELNAFGKNVSQNILDSQLTRFRDIQFDSISRFYPLPKNLVLPYNHNQISFEFAAIEPARPYLVKYQYILEGYSKEWSPVTDRTSVSYGNMYEGTYTFKLKAQNRYGVWSEPVTYTFKVLPPWWRTWWVYSFYVVLGICMVLLVTWWNGRRLRLKAKELAVEVRKATVTILEQKKIVEEQKKVVEEQKHFVEEKNKHITDSINYAQRIQNAILPESNYIQSLFENYFIYYQPKEIVSGDFYWFGQKDDKVIFASVDCTGHGVPGALMSMIGNALLNEIINGKGIVESDEILNHLRNDIIYALKQTDAPESQKDGMDIALCVLDKNKNLLEFSGAHNSLYHFRDDVFTEFKGDKQAIGYEKRERQAFEKNRIKIQKGDIIYLFTDGFADQKGGIEKRKFYYKPFRELLAFIKNESMVKQEEILRDKFNNWKGNMEQIDDVLVIGIKI
jgi:ligand-binding sensor domain-containing protein/serine phosphatase RsbU (regulator of sigma subunit)